MMLSCSIYDIDHECSMAVVIALTCDIPRFPFLNIPLCARPRTIVLVSVISIPALFEKMILALIPRKQGLKLGVTSDFKTSLGST